MFVLFETIDWSVFIGLTLILFGGTAWLTGQNLAYNWRSVRLVLPFTILLSFGNRFLDYGLFDGILWNLPRFIFDTLVLFCYTYGSYKINTARKMVKQYPWLYKRTGLWSWEEVNA